MSTKARKLFAVPIIEIVDAATLTERLYFYRITDEGELEELGFVENRESFAYQSESEIRVQDLYLRRAFFGENFVYARERRQYQIVGDFGIGEGEP